ncbi:hypothetical protein PIB30_098827 [Stylosanthes scabra]|uniref:Uncharacterized protein n=1 Tax=Stylosanthes scabra TaxID=79078 RepID=A0ABU6YY33_9FABA|nr:hypothetical protein [Stylosanthes scabra]
MGNQPRQPFHDPNANTYNPGWRNHPNLGWGGNQNAKNGNFQNRPPYQQFQRPPFQPPFRPQQPGECKAITLRSGRALEDVGNKVNVQPTMEKSKEDATKETKIQQPQHLSKATEKSAKKEENIPFLNNYERR